MSARPRRIPVDPKPDSVAKADFTTDFRRWLAEICGPEHRAAYAAGVSELAQPVTDEYRASILELDDECLAGMAAALRVYQWWDFIQTAAAKRHGTDATNMLGVEAIVAAPGR